MKNENNKNFYVFTLYISGMNINSLSAVKNLKSICEKYLSGHYEITVIDLLKNPEKALENQIIAIPTLVKELPAPVRRLIGDLSNTKQVLFHLEIRQES